MRSRPLSLAALSAALLLLAACAPAAPSPTAAPAKPAEAAKPAATAAPAKPTEATKPAEKPAEAKPAAKPTEAPAAKAAEAKPAASPAAKATFDEKAVADFYRGKAVRIIVGFAAGGGFDIYSRNIAKHMPKHIPGNPVVVVENMPGASSMLALNHVANVAPKDGTTIANMIGTLALQQLFGNPGVQFDMAKLNYLGVPNASTYIGTFHKRAGIRTWEDALSKEIVLGADAPGSTVTDAPALLRDLLGAKFKLVEGFGGTSQIRLAIERSEVDGFFNGWDSTKLTNLKDVQNGDWLLVVQMTTEKLKEKEVEGVPGINDITTNEEHRKLLYYSTDAPNRFLRPYTVAPEVPADRLAALQDAFVKTMQDKEFLADAEKAKLDVAPLTGAQVKRLVTDLLNMPAEIKSKLQKAMVP
jgi:tripartite-type tricarboxylate transporter receptor subunit TctC